MKTLGAVQPSYLAWIPFFKRMAESDVFVYLDDVEYSKNSFHNRNRIKGPQGSLLLTVPINYTGHSKTLIKNIPIAKPSDWAKKHLKSIELNYSKAPFFKEFYERLSPIYKKDWQTLGELNTCLIDLVRDYFSIKTPCYLSSELDVKNFFGNEKLIQLCKKFEADVFLVKPGTESYHPSELFNNNGIKFKNFVYQDVPYPQTHGEYLFGLSAIDLAMNCGPKGFSSIHGGATT